MFCSSARARRNQFRRDSRHAADRGPARSGGGGALLIGGFANELGQLTLKDLAHRRRFARQPAAGKNLRDVLGCLVLHRFIPRMKACQRLAYDWGNPGDFSLKKSDLAASRAPLFRAIWRLFAVLGSRLRLTLLPRKSHDSHPCTLKGADMKRRIPEPDLVIPTLELLDSSPNGEMLTTNIILALSARFRPEGEDNEILAKRSDTKFSQKVRNLKSHKTLVKAGLAIEIYRGFKITPAGKRLVASLKR
ncbi:MAG TPA: hypothetical protein VGL83_11680 [Stellaceae bacterium]